MCLGGGMVAIWLWAGCNPEIEPEPLGEETTPFEGDAAGECSNGADDDQNGYFDCDDIGCWNSPDCDTTEPTVPPPAGTTPSPPPVTTPPPPSTTNDCNDAEPPLICDLRTVSLTYYVYFDYHLLLTPCLVALQGDGVFESSDGRWSVHLGTWGFNEALTSCNAEKDAFQTWAGSAYHSFYFSDDGDFLYDWYSHRDIDDADEEGDPVFYITEMDVPFDASLDAPVAVWEYEEPLPGGYTFVGDLIHQFTVTFGH